MPKIKEVFRKPRVWVLIIVVALCLLAIFPNPNNSGVIITGVLRNSSASLAGIEGPTAGTPPMFKEKIISINNVPVKTLADYYDFVDTLVVNRTFILKTNKELYRLTALPLYNITVLNETYTVNVTKPFFNETLNETVNITEQEERHKIKKEIIGVAPIGLLIGEAPTSNIRFGLDLSGGTRVLLRPEEEISQDDLSLIIENIKERLNVFGLSDIVVRPARDLSGAYFILVEIPGASKEEVRELLSQQGKFEAKIENDTVFTGGQDITFVCRSPDCSGLDPQVGCSQSGSTWGCRFRFSITLSQEAAERQAALTKNLDIITENNQQYLSKSLTLYLDNEQVDELRIGAELKGKASTDIEISGSGIGNTRQEAVENAYANMKRLQTILITGSLPVKLNIEKTDQISPVLGQEFLKNIGFVGILVIVAVGAVIFARYRNIKISGLIMMTVICEVVIILGVASVIRWNIDLSAIAGLLIAVGTGVDQKIVITNETMQKETAVFLRWKDKIKNAFFMIMGSYLTVFVAMLPLMWAGVGLLKGFAITTIIGASAGVFIARPAFAAMLEVVFKEE